MRTSGSPAAPLPAAYHRLLRCDTCCGCNTRPCLTFKIAAGLRFIAALTALACLSGCGGHAEPPVASGSSTGAGTAAATGNAAMSGTSTDAAFDVMADAADASSCPSTAARRPFAQCRVATARPASLWTTRHTSGRASRAWPTGSPAGNCSRRRRAVRAPVGE
jgi:hypothetical protein